MVATLVRPAIFNVAHGLQNYDGDENTNWAQWREKPFRVGALDDNSFDETNLETQFPAATHQAMHIWVRHSTIGWVVYKSTRIGTTWSWGIEDLVCYSVVVVPEGVPLTTGTAKVTLRLPYAMRMLDVRAALEVASSSGAVSIDVNKAGTTVFSTVVTVAASAKTSVGGTPAVFTNNTFGGGSRDFADDVEVTVDIDGAGTGATGLRLTFRGVRCS